MAVTYIFSPNTRIESAKVNADFDDVESGKALNDGMSFSPVLNNTIALQAKDSGGTKRDLLQLTSGDDTQANVVSGKVFKITDGSNIFQIDPAVAKGGPWVPVFTGFSVSPVVGTARFFEIGKKVTVNVTLSSNGTSNDTVFTMTLPVAAKTLANYTVDIWGLTLVDTGSKVKGHAQITSGGTLITFYRENYTNSNSVTTFSGWTGSGVKGFESGINFIYERD